MKFKYIEGVIRIGLGGAILGEVALAAIPGSERQVWDGHAPMHGYTEHIETQITSGTASFLTGYLPYWK